MTTFRSKLLLASPLQTIANEVASKLHCDKHGSCVHFAEEFVLAVFAQAPNLLDTFEVIEGYVDTPIGDGIPQQHTWIQLANGEKIDPTFIQFGRNSHYRPRIKHSIPGREYLETTQGGTWFSRRREEHPDWFKKSKLLLAKTTT